MISQLRSGGDCVCGGGGHVFHARFVLFGCLLFSCICVCFGLGFIEMKHCFNKFNSIVVNFFSKSVNVCWGQS